MALRLCFLFDRESALRMVCKSFDKNGDGKIDKSELKAIYAEIGRNLSEEVSS